MTATLVTDERSNRDMEIALFPCISYTNFENKKRSSPSIMQPNAPLVIHHQGCRSVQPMLLELESQTPLVPPCGDGRRGLSSIPKHYEDICPQPKTRQFASPSEKGLTSCHSGVALTRPCTNLDTETSDPIGRGCHWHSSWCARFGRRCGMAYVALCCF